MPGANAIILNTSGDVIFKHSEGVRGLDTKKPMTLDTFFWLASCTKLLTSIACLQLYEQGKLDLDDADIVEKHCPALKDVKVLVGFTDDGKPILEEKRSRITARMLLTHTCRSHGC